MAKNIWTGAVSGDYGATGNWSLGAIPAAGDDVYFQNNSVSVTAGLDQHLVALNSFNVGKDYTGTFGLATPTYLYIDALIVNIGVPAISATGNGSTRLNLKTLTAGTVINVYGSGNSADAGSTPVRLLGTAAMVLNVFGGTVGVALSPAESTAVTTLTTQTTGTSIAVTLGSGVTVTTLNHLAGNLVDYSANAHTTATISGTGNYVYRGTGAFTTLNVGATMFHNGSGTVTKLNLQGTINFTGGNTAMTITDADLYFGSVYSDGNARVTNTNPMSLKLCTLNNIVINLGFGSTVRR